MPNPVQVLHRLATSYGVQTAYYDVKRRRTLASPETLLRVLAAYGAPVRTASDAAEALRQRRQEFWSRIIEPVIVAWDGRLSDWTLRLPGNQAACRAHFQLELETGQRQEWTHELAEQTVKDAREIEGAEYVLKNMPERDHLPSGYHSLHVEIAGQRRQAMVISAPKRVYSGGPKSRRRTWGVFAPLYALQSEGSWGGGNLSDLEALWSWTTELGGGMAATLPLLAAFLDEPFDPSPYTPASRLFWNEFYLDLRRIPELNCCRAAQELIASADFQQEIESLRSAELVDYRRRMALQRRVLEELSRTCFSENGPRRAALERFIKERPGVEDYSRFRAVCERQRSGWPHWPERLRDGALQADDYEEAAERYHQYVQWVAHEQIRSLVEKAGRTGPGLYLDLPLGVHRHGYDTWREREAFALEASGGAPPDAFFTKGQNWGFAPLHPERLREQRYRHLIACFRNHLEHAGMLRIDHVMGLHRLYWVPEGMSAGEGAYVRYYAEEIYAVLSVESHRHGSYIVGENLGTVPAFVNAAMKRHGLRHMYVAQYESNTRPGAPLNPVPRDCVASLNTHDMPPFAAYWGEFDIDDLHALGLFDEQDVREERKNRRAVRDKLVDFLRQRGWLSEESASVAEVMAALHAFLAASDAEIVLLNLEDLWLETQPQNTPGTFMERVNWRRKARHSVEELSQLPGLVEQLRRVAQLRQSGTE